ncbi:MAG: P-type conjugative transfer protein TrbJ [bacterium]|nr:P-type conjugative transfer protein TrbJ [bacterium]
MNIFTLQKNTNKFKKLSITALISISLATNSLNASGIPVIDVASIAQAVTNYNQMLKDYTMQVQQYEQLYSQLQQQMRMVQMQVQNLQNLKNYDWKDLGTILYQARNVMSKIEGISYDLGNVSREFEKIYKTSDEYSDILKNAPNESARNKAYSEQYDEMLTKNQNTFKGTLQKLELMESDFDSETKIIAKLKQRSQNSKGALEVAQAGNDLIAYQIDETRKLRKVMMDQSNMMTNYSASLNNEKILGKAKDDAIDNKDNRNNPYTKSNPNALKIR